MDGGSTNAAAVWRVAIGVCSLALTISGGALLVDAVSRSVQSPHVPVDKGAVAPRGVAEAPVVHAPSTRHHAPAVRDVSSGPQSAPPRRRVASETAATAVWFSRDGTRVVVDVPRAIVDGVTVEHLAQGVGWYPHSARLGTEGNVALAGHRTTHGAPFRHLDELVVGDRVHLADDAGGIWTYRVVESRVVAPDDVWVVGNDPLGKGRAMVTLTTCHPVGSAAQRLVVWGERVGVERPQMLWGSQGRHR
ncbi:MAG: class E sortase [Nitriliruptoraceae bacterium]